MDSRAIVGASSLSATSLLLHLLNYVGSPSSWTPPPSVFDCPVCPEAAPWDWAAWQHLQAHIPSLLLGLALGVACLPCVDLLLFIRAYLLHRLLPEHNPRGALRSCVGVPLCMSLELRVSHLEDLACRGARAARPAPGPSRGV